MCAALEVIDSSCWRCLQYYLYELIIKQLVSHNRFYQLHQFLQYHVLSDSKPLVRGLLVKAQCI